MQFDMAQTKYGQMTPPEDSWEPDPGAQTLTIAESEVIQADPSSVITRMQRGRGGSGGSSSSSSRGGSDSSSGLHTTNAKVDKKDKYREKNRVAAAKCRAKKKEHVDGLEENHRAQSMLNSLLKQTEQNLRDELSYWRTQALQHAFCDCHAVQDYNLKKARALAADKDFGGPDGLRPDPMCASSPSMNAGHAPFLPSPDGFEMPQA